MADSVNQQIADALTERQLRAGRVETDLKRQAWAILALLEADILAALKANDPTEFVLLARRRREVDTLMAEELDPLITARYAQLARLMDEAMARVAINEAGAVQRLVNATTEDTTIEDTPPDAALKRRVAGALFPTPSRPTDLSTTGATWWQRQGESLVQRLGDSLMVGVSVNESLAQLTTVIKGTSEAAFQDGLMGKAREDAARLVTTQTTNALGEARAATAERNAAGLMLIHQSILDSRTSTICLARHGLKFTADEAHEPIGHDMPYLNGVPYHPNCRSSMLTVLRDGGAVHDETLTAWLRRKGPAFQNDVLGPTRAQMFRDGRLNPRQLLDATSGKPLTLEELGV